VQTSAKAAEWNQELQTRRPAREQNEYAKSPRIEARKAFYKMEENG